MGEAGALTRRSWRDDESRWRHVSAPHGANAPLAARQAHTITQGDLETFVAVKLGQGLNPATVGHLMKLLSRVFSFAIRHSEQTGVRDNPVWALDRSVRRLYRPTHDPRNIPFIEKLSDVKRLIGVLSEPYATMLAVGAYAGLRPGEVKALHWDDVDLVRRRIKVWRQVVRGALGP